MNNSFQYIKDNSDIDTEFKYPYEAVIGKCRFNQSTVSATDDVNYFNIELYK